MAESTPVVQKWVEREISRGLQGLVALRLAGGPAQDSITLTLDVWLAAIETQAQGWNEQADAKRIQSAFRTLYRICDRWPPPKLFLENLGNRDPPPALPPPRITEEQRKKNVTLLHELTKKLRQKKTMP